MGIRKERVRRLCLRHKQTVAMSAQEGYSSLQEADGAASSCPQRGKSTKSPSHRGRQGSFWRRLSPRKGVWKREERRCEGHAKVKNTWHLRTSGPSSQPFDVAVWDAVSGRTSSFEESPPVKEFLSSPVSRGDSRLVLCLSLAQRNWRPTNQSAQPTVAIEAGSRASKHRAEHLGTTCWAGAGLRMPNVTMAGQSRELMHTGMQLPYWEGPLSTTHPVAAAGAPRGTGHDTPRKAILFDYPLYI